MTGSPSDSDFEIPIRPRKIPLGSGFTIAGHTEFIFEPDSELGFDELQEIVEDIVASSGEYARGELGDGHYKLLDTARDYSAFEVIVEPASGFGPHVYVNVKDSTTEGSVKKFWEQLTERADFEFEKHVTRNVDQ